MSRERKMPSNVDAEQAVLGACLLDRDAIFAIDLAANEFYLEKHQNIYAAMAELARADVPIDLLSVQSKLTAQNRLTESGGIVYLTDLLSSVPSASCSKRTISAGCCSLTASTASRTCIGNP